MKFVMLIAALLTAACGCPATHGAEDIKDEWTAQRDAACAAVDGCDAAFIEQTPVFREALNDVHEICDDGRGCFCGGEGCAGVIVFADTDAQGYRQSDTVLHEYVHAAFWSHGVDTGAHPPEFLAALARARASISEHERH